MCVLLVQFVMSQTIDSAKILTHNSLPNYYLKVAFQHSGFSLVRVELGYINQKQYVNYFFKECSGNTGLYYFDTTFINTGSVFPGFSSFTIKTSLDTNTIDTSNCAYRSNALITDSVLFDNTNIDTEENQSSPQLSIFPTPCQEAFTLCISNTTEFAQMELYNSLGVLVLESEISFLSGKAYVEIGIQPSGFYVVRLNINGVIKQIKMIVE